MSLIPIATRARYITNRSTWWRPLPNAEMSVEEARRLYNAGSAELFQRHDPNVVTLLVYIRHTPACRRAYFDYLNLGTSMQERA